MKCAKRRVCYMLHTNISIVCISPIELSWILEWPVRLNSSQDSRRSRSDGPQSSVGFVESRNFCEADGKRSQCQSRIPVGLRGWEDRNTRGFLYWILLSGLVQNIRLRTCTRTWRVICSSLHWDTGYPDWGFS
jgi:hypothetical protein